jgi:hypothetical protein
MLNLRVLFPEMKETHEMGFVKFTDGNVRVMYNRDDKNDYIVRDGKFTFDGRPAPLQRKCEKPPG